LIGTPLTAYQYRGWVRSTGYERGRLEACTSAYAVYCREVVYSPARGLGEDFVRPDDGRTVGTIGWKRRAGEAVL